MQQKLDRLAAELDERYFALSDNTDNITPEASAMFQKARAAEALALVLSPKGEQFDEAIHEAIYASSDLDEAMRAAEAMLRAK
jgi:predicted xylose isomerase-like sugar epimerase